jgi:hypothetical protein
MVRAAGELQRRSWRFYGGVALWVVFCVWLVTVSVHLVSIAVMGSIALAIYVFGVRERWQGEQTASAYSVFNDGGREIAGTFNARQFDRQLRGVYGGALDDDNDSGAGSGAPTHTAAKAPAEKISDDERVRRRKAAAAAAEARFAATAKATAAE